MALIILFFAAGLARAVVSGCFDTRLQTTDLWSRATVQWRPVGGDRRNSDAEAPLVNYARLLFHIFCVVQSSCRQVCGEWCVKVCPAVLLTCNMWMCQVCGTQLPAPRRPAPATLAWSPAAAQLWPAAVAAAGTCLAREVSLTHNSADCNMSHLSPGNRPPITRGSPVPPSSTSSQLAIFAIVFRRTPY